MRDRISKKSYSIPVTDQKLSKMLAKTPVTIESIGKKSLEMEITRIAITAEFDAINLYEQLAAQTDNEGIRKVLLDVAKEEKTHVGEFQALLLELDQEQVRELEEGGREARELIRKQTRVT